MSRKTPKRQLVILNCILSSRGIWHQTTSWRPRKYPQAQTWLHIWIFNVNILFSQSKIYAKQKKKVTDFSVNQGNPFLSNVLSNQDHLLRKRWFEIPSLLLKKVKRRFFFFRTFWPELDYNVHETLPLLQIRICQWKSLFYGGSTHHNEHPLPSEILVEVLEIKWSNCLDQVALLLLGAEWFRYCN